MLPTYAAMYGIIGLLFLLQSPDRYGPSYDLARLLVPGGNMRWWAAAFLAVAACEVAALLAHNRLWYLVWLSVGAGLATAWGLLLAVSAAFDTDASFTTGAWVLAWLPAHVATTLSLARDERGVTPRR